MPSVSEEFLAWLRGVMIPEVAPFASLTGETAIKQVAFAQGILFLKAKIVEGQKKNQEGANFASPT